MKIAYRLFFVLLISMMLFGCGEKTASIEGKIIDGKGKPVSGVSVIFKQVQPTQGYEQFETKTGSDGIFRLSGLAPVSDYIITILSDKWKTKVTQKIKTLEAGESLSLNKPIKIRFQQMKDGTILDTKTSLQWYIHPALDINAQNVVSTVKGLKIGDYNDWRLPLRDEINGLQNGKIPAKKSSKEPVFVNKTCCAWVSIGKKDQDVDWKFYIEEENELWASSKESPDNRIIIVRNTVATPVKAKVISALPQPEKKTSPSTEIKSVSSTTKAPEGIRYASRKACAEKKAKIAEAAKVVQAKEVNKIKALPAKAETESITKETASPVKTTTNVSQQIPVPVKKQEASVSISESVYFESGSSSLSTLQLAKLKVFTSKLSGKKGTLIIDGHSDSTSGNKSANLMLSLERSSKVITTLNNLGLGGTMKMEVKASGDAKPIASDDTAEGRSLNRRVDIKFISE